MRKFFLLLVLVVICVGTLSAASADTYVVTTEEDPLNIRALPQGTVIGILRKGTAVDVLRKEWFDGCEWAVIEYEGNQVYLFGIYLTPTEQSSMPIVSSSSKSGIDIVNGVNPYITIDGATLYQVDVKGGLNVRYGPSIKKDIKVRVRNQGYVWVLETTEDGTWARVQYAPMRYGYVMTKYLVPAN